MESSDSETNDHTDFSKIDNQTRESSLKFQSFLQFNIKFSILTISKLVFTIMITCTLLSMSYFLSETDHAEGNPSDYRLIQNPLPELPNKFRNIGPSRFLSINGPSFLGNYSTDVSSLFRPRLLKSGGILFCADDADGAHILNVSNPNNVTLIKRLFRGQGAYRDFTFSDDETIAIVTKRYCCAIFFLNITNISNIQTISSLLQFNVPLESKLVDLKYLFVVDYTSGLKIINISNFTAPSVLSTYNTNISLLARSTLTKDKKIIFLADSSKSKGFWILNISNVSNPILISKYSTINCSYTCLILSADETALFVCDFSLNSGMLVFNITDILNPRVIANISTPNCQYYDGILSGDGTTLFIVDRTQNNGIVIFNVGNLTNPILLGSYNANISLASGIELSNDSKIAYVGDAAYYKGLFILNVSQFYFQCKNGEFLYPNGTCIPTCDPPFVKRIDGYTYCDDNPCKQNITANRQYYLNGYCLQCSVYCQSCTSNTNCSQCIPPAILMNRTCVCPKGMFLNQSNICDLDVLMITGCNNQECWFSEDINLTVSSISNQTFLSNFVIKWSCFIIRTGGKVEICNDPGFLFNKTYINTRNLTLPMYYLRIRNENEANFTFIANITFDSNNSSINKTITIREKYYLSISPIDYYSSNLDYIMIANPSNFLRTNNVSFTWNITPSLNFSANNNTLFLFQNSVVWPKTQRFITVTFYANIFNKSSYFQKFIPVNSPPENGSLRIIPQAGICLITQYYIYADGWQDFNLPNTYKFSYLTSNLGSPISLSPQFQTSEFMTTILPDQKNNITILLEVRDNLKATTIISNKTNCTSPTKEEVLWNADSILKGIFNNPNSTSSVLLLAIDQYTSQLSLIENALNASSILSSLCPICSKNGYCPISQCVCDNSWTGTACNINKTIANQVTAIKSTIIAQISNMISQNDTQQSAQLLENLNQLSNNSDFNSLKTIYQVQKIIANFTNSSETLPLDQAIQLSKLIDNSLGFISDYDCLAISNISETIINNTQTYFDLISNSLVKDNVAFYPDGFSLQRNNYAMRVISLSVCSAANYTIKPSTSSAPNVNLLYMGNNPLDCNQNLTVQRIELNSNLMSCNSSAPKIFSTISLKLINQTINQATELNFSVNIQLNQSGLVVCKNGCFLEGQKCKCANLKFLDFKSQIWGLISESRLKDIQFRNLSFGTLLSATFWVLFFLTLINVLFIIILRKYENKDWASKMNTKKRKLTFRSKLLFSFLISNDFFVIFIKKETLSKSQRMFLYHIRLNMLLAFNTIFGLDDGLNLHDFWSNLTKFTFNPYLSVLPYITIIPIYKLVQFLMTKTLHSAKAKSIKMKILLIFGLGIGLNICLSFIMLAITSQLRKTFIDRWIFNFILMFVQDFLIMPYIHLLIAKGKVTLLKWKKIKGFPKLRSFIWNSMDQFIARFLYNFDITSSRKKIKKRVVVEKVQQEFSFEDPNPNNRFSRPKLRRTMNQNS